MPQTVSCAPPKLNGQESPTETRNLRTRVATKEKPTCDATKGGHSRRVDLVLGPLGRRGGEPRPSLAGQVKGIAQGGGRGRDGRLAEDWAKHCSGAGAEEPSG